MDQFTFDLQLPPGPPLPREPLPPNQPSEITTEPLKMRRISRACDSCHKRSIKCPPNPEDPDRCMSCVEYGIACTYHRPIQKRGMKSGSTRKPRQLNGLTGNSRMRDETEDANLLIQFTNNRTRQELEDVSPNVRHEVQGKWKTMAFAAKNQIHALVQSYFDMLYPLFPIFNAANMLARIDNREYLTELSFFVETMAVCALVSARARDGALFGAVNNNEVMSPETFFTAAKESLPQGVDAMRGVEWMRSCACLTLYGIQVGRVDVVQQYLGTYHILVSIDGLHDEKNWPKHIGFLEIEMRRRLFWLMYTLDVYSCVIWDTDIRGQEKRSRVYYPSEIDDYVLSETSYMIPPREITKDCRCWLHDWSFTTDLYRLLEHAMIGHYRRQPNLPRATSNTGTYYHEPTQSKDLLQKALEPFWEFYPQFRDVFKTPGLTGGPEDRFTFQTANIVATLQLLRMVLITSDDASTTVEQKCSIACELVADFAKFPVDFLRTVSKPLLYLLLRFGSFLNFDAEDPVSEPCYERVRFTLLQLASLVGPLEMGHFKPIGAAEQLRKQVSRLDKIMAHVRHLKAGQHGKGAA